MENNTKLISSLFGSISTLETFSLLLTENAQLEKFKKLVLGLTTGKMSPQNISWKSTLDMGTLSMCETTTNMRYDRDCVEFFSLFNLIFGSSAINVLRGTGHFGSVVCNSTSKGKFEPSLGNFNFAIPSVNTLRKIASEYRKEVDVGFITQNIDIAQQQAKDGAQFVLSMDGKMVAQGCKNESDGDVDLWGREIPTLSQSVELLQLRTQCAAAIDFPSSPITKCEHTIGFRRLALHISRTLKQLYSRMKHSFFQRQKLNRLAKENPDNVTRYNTRMSFLHQNSSDCDSVFKQGIDLQEDVLKALRIINGWPPLDEENNHTNLSAMPNCFQLLHPDEVGRDVDLNNPSHYEYIKQGSTQWHNVRKLARVTGSSLYRAIGLDTLNRQKEHHYSNVCGRSEATPDPLLQRRLDHGRQNEVNIISSLVTTIMPAFLPRCYAYFEVGPRIIQFGENALKVEVSADGILRCPNGTQCPNYSDHADRKIVIEMKSPYPTKENPHSSVHEVPHRYVSQILCECKAWECDEAWLLVGTKTSTTAFRCFNDNVLLCQLLTIADDLYSAPNPPVPTRLHHSIAEMKEKIKQYRTTHTSFFLESPSTTGYYGDLVKSTEVISAYAVTPNHNFQEVAHNDVDYQVAVCSNEGKRFFLSAHTVLRKQATEVLVFMATNKDRIQTDTMPYSFPIAYAMKGSSMSNEDLRYMMDKLLSELRNKSIPVLCEVFDGQWHNYITTDRKNNCLTKLCWRHKWQEVSNYSKNKCIEKMVSGCRIKPGNMELLTTSERLGDGCSAKHGNINITCSIADLDDDTRIKTLHVTSTGGTEFKRSVIDQIVTVCKHSRPDLFPEEIGFSTCHTYADPPNTPLIPNETESENSSEIHRRRDDDHTYSANVNETVTMNDSHSDKAVTKRSMRRKKLVGMGETEQNLLHLLDINVVTSILDDIDETDTEEDLTSSELLIYVLLDNRCLLLDDILCQLQYCDAVKWGCTSKRDLFPGLLDSHEHLSAKCTLKDLKIISKTIEHHTERIWYESGLLKNAQVNRIVRAFGGIEGAETRNIRKKNQIFNAPLLRMRAKEELLREEYKTENLQIALGTVLARECKQGWFRRSSLDPTAFIPFCDADDDDANGESVELFSYPETNSMNEPQFKTFDYTHILTNMRSHVLTRGYEYCKRDDFEWIVDNTTGVLSRYLVEYNMDSQNAFSAMKVFGEEVIMTLESNNRKGSVEFLKLVKSWHNACDERGIRADVRVRALCNMHQFLTKNINFWSVPFNTREGILPA